MNKSQLFTPQRPPLIVLALQGDQLSGAVLFPGTRVSFGHRIVGAPQGDAERSWADYARLLAQAAPRYWFAASGLASVLANVSDGHTFARCLPLDCGPDLDSSIQAALSIPSEERAGLGYSEFGLDPLDLAATGLYTIPEIAGLSRMPEARVVTEVQAAVHFGELSPCVVLPDFRHAELQPLHSVLTMAGQPSRVYAAVRAEALRQDIEPPLSLEIDAYRKRAAQALRATRPVS